jgi:nicotinate phosphoribosyltransferase
MRSQTLANYKHLPASMTSLDSACDYPVTISRRIKAMANQLDTERLMPDPEAAK